MSETDTDAADQFDARMSPEKLNEKLPGLWQRYRRLPRNIFAISLVSLLNDISSEIIYPFLPIFLSLTLGASPAIVGLIEGTAESLSSLLKLFSGYFSDRRGKRKVFVGNKTIEDLKSYLVKHKDKETFLLPCSNYGAKDVTRYLDSINLKYKEVMMYQTVSSDLSDLSDVTYDVLVFFTPQAIVSLYENFPDFKQNETRIAVSGNQTAKAVVLQ